MLVRGFLSAFFRRSRIVAKPVQRISVPSPRLLLQSTAFIRNCTSDVPRLSINFRGKGCPHSSETGVSPLASYICDSGAATVWASSQESEIMTIAKSNMGFSRRDTKLKFFGRVRALTIVSIEMWKFTYLWDSLQITLSSIKSLLRAVADLRNLPADKFKACPLFIQPNVKGCLNVAFPMVPFCDSSPSIPWKSGFLRPQDTFWIATKMFNAACPSLTANISKARVGLGRRTPRYTVRLCHYIPILKITGAPELHGLVLRSASTNQLLLNFYFVPQLKCAGWFSCFFVRTTRLQSSRKCLLWVTVAINFT